MIRAKIAAKFIFSSRQNVRFTLPDLNHAPACLLEYLLSISIALNVAGELWEPVFLVRCRQFGKPAPGMLVPKAAMYEDHCSVFWENQVGCAGQIATMKSEPKTETMQNPAHSPLWGGIGRSNTAHIEASLPRGVTVDH